MVTEDEKMTLKRNGWKTGLPVILLSVLLTPAHGIEVTLASEGQALMPVVTGADAPDSVREAAASLAEYLGRISGTGFTITDGDGAEGIAVGRMADFDGLGFDPGFGDGPFDRESYILRSHENGVWILGATELAVRHGVWDVLHRLGYRQYFPGETWEIVPQRDTLTLAVDTVERPDYYARRIWYNWGMRWGYNQEPYRQWCTRNRAVRGFELHSGHAYGQIHAARRAAFEENPEYYALIDGERRHRGGDTKFCIGNPGLRQLVKEYAVETMRNHPDRDSLSMDPSDGGNWCDDTCEKCAQLGSGSISDRALTLANEVAEAINALDLGDKYVGMYAYNLHGPPPTIAVHPRVIISVATGFLRGGYSLDEIIAGWREKGATLGIYDYFSVIAWDWNLPRRARGGRPHELARRIPGFHAEGARFFDAEAGDAWGPYGLGYYVAARLMWDTREAESVDEIIERFLDDAFGPAREPMQDFYRVTVWEDQRRGTSDMLGRMYRHLRDARALAGDRPDVLERIDALILYTRYVDLYQAFAGAVGDGRDTARDAVLSHAYRMRETMMIHAYGLWARLIGQAAAHTGDHPLKDDRPFSEEHILTFLSEGIARHQPVELTFQALDFSDALVPAAERLGLDEVESAGRHPPVPQDRQNYYLWIEPAPAELTLKVTVQKRWDLRPHKITLYSPKAVDVEAVDQSDIVKPDGETYTVVLKTPYSGLHRIAIQDGGDHTRIEWPDDVRVTLPAIAELGGLNNHFRGAWTLYFYVPQGTDLVGGWAERVASWAPPLSGVVRDGDGNPVHDFGGQGDGHFSIEVPEGQDGKLWKAETIQGVIRLKTVPSYFAATAGDLLLPQEVVEADQRP